MVATKGVLIVTTTQQVDFDDVKLAHYVAGLINDGQSIFTGNGWSLGDIGAGDESYAATVEEKK